MTTLKSDEHSEQPRVSVLEQVKAERDAQLRRFEHLLTDTSEYAVFVATTSDEELIEFYEFIARKEKQLSFIREDENDENLMRIRTLLSKLEDLPVIQERLNRQELTPEEQEEINRTVQFISERQKLKKMGPVKKLVYNIQKKVNRK